MKKIANWFSQFWSLIKFISIKYWIKSILWLAGMFSVFYLFHDRFDNNKVELGKRWAFVFDPTFTVFSLIIPIILGFLLLYKEWEESLDRKLIVHFSIVNKINKCKEYVFSCYNVNLLHGTDMRAISQQIGSQMGDGVQLRFNPSVKPIEETTILIKNHSNKSEWIKYSEIEFLLNSEPSTISKNEQSYLVWNLFKEEKLEKKLKIRPDVPLHYLGKEKCSLENLLSSNEQSKNDFMIILEGEFIQNDYDRLIKIKKLKNELKTKNIPNKG
jgi:hypothetical protein